MSLSGLSESTTAAEGDNPRSIAALVYAKGHLNGYRPPTRLDIPQLKIPQLEAPPADEEFRQYQRQLRDFEELGDICQIPDLGSVPEVFSRPDFSLDNPRIFTQVVGSSETIDYTILLEKLSWYIDIVELHLLDSISNASSSFFEVTSQFNTIENGAKNTTAALSNIKESLKKIQQFTTHESATLAMQERLHGIDELASYLTQMQGFYSAYLHCKQVYETQPPPAALLALEKCKLLLSEPHNLTGVRALDRARHDLDSFEGGITSYFRTEMVKVLMQDLETHIDSVSTKDTLERIGRILHVPGQKQSHNYNNSWMNMDGQLRDKLDSLINGAFNANVHIEALKDYKDQVQLEVKALVRQALPPSTGRDMDNLGALSQSLKALSVVEFEHILCKVFTGLSEAFRRISSQTKLLLDLCSHLGFAPPTDDLLQVLVSSTDSRLAKVLKVRREITASISVEEFMHIYSLCGIFMSECESICSIYAPELAAYLAGQTRLFTQTFTNTSLKELGTSLDLDPWKKEELPPSFQTNTDLIIESGDQNPVLWLKQWRSLIDAAGQRSSESNTVKRLPQNVFIKNDSFFIAKSTVKLVDILGNLLKLVCLLPQTTVDLSVVYVDLIALFNSRTRSLILGTGAMTSGSGLKRITFRHLSLAYESLRFTTTLLQHSRGCVKRHLQNQSSSTFATQCDELTTQLNDHQADLETKFIRIMSDKSQSYARSISITNWSAPNEPANQYMQGLVKDISTVSRILEDTLKKSIALNIVSKIFAQYKQVLLEAFTSIRIPNTMALENVMRDVGYFRDHVNDVNGANNIGEVLFETMTAFATPEVDDNQPNINARSASPQRLAVNHGDVTLGDASDADISIRPSLDASRGSTETIRSSMDIPGISSQATPPLPTTENEPKQSAPIEPAQKQTAPKVSVTPPNPAGPQDRAESIVDPQEEKPEPVQDIELQLPKKSEAGMAESIYEPVEDTVDEHVDESVPEEVPVRAEASPAPLYEAPEIEQTAEAVKAEVTEPSSPAVANDTVEFMLCEVEPKAEPAQVDASASNGAETGIKADASLTNDQNADSANVAPSGLPEEEEKQGSDHKEPAAGASQPSGSTAGQANKKKKKKKGKKK